MLKQTVTTVSDHIFPGIGLSFSAKAELPKAKSSKLWLYYLTLPSHMQCIL